MTLIQEELTIIAIWLLASVNAAIVGHISGQVLGKFILNLWTCIIGFNVNYVDYGVIKTFKCRDAWDVLTALDELKYHAAIKARDDEL